MASSSATAVASSAKATVHFRTTVVGDVPALKAVIDATDLFPGDLLDDMCAPFLTGSTADTEVWLTAVADGKTVGVAYAALERFTEGTYNLLLIAVHPDQQGTGIGKALVEQVEAIVTSKAARILLIETSGLDKFAPQRAFYTNRGYTAEARIRDYYNEGEDKCVFWKKLSAKVQVTTTG